MDPQYIIAMALEIVLERERQNKRLMKESLRAQKIAVRGKRRERSMLKRKKQRMLAKEAAKKKLIDDFMVYITAIENNDLQTFQNFDEKTMMNTVATMMNSDAGDNGGFSGGHGGINNTPENAHNLGEVDKMTAAEGTNSDVGEGSNAGGYGGSYSGSSRK